MELSDKWRSHSLLIPPTHFCCPSDKCPSFPMVLLWQAVLLPLQQDSICLQMTSDNRGCPCAVLPSMAMKESGAWVGGRKYQCWGKLPLSWARAGWEVGGLLETGWCSSFCSKQPCSSHIYLVFFAMCVSRTGVSLEIKAHERKLLFFVFNIWCSENQTRGTVIIWPTMLGLLITETSELQTRLWTNGKEPPLPIPPLLMHDQCNASCPSHSTHFYFSVRKYTKGCSSRNTFLFLRRCSSFSLHAALPGRNWLVS